MTRQPLTRLDKDVCDLLSFWVTIAKGGLLLAMQLDWSFHKKKLIQFIFNQPTHVQKSCKGKSIYKVIRIYVFYFL